MKSHQSKFRPSVVVVVAAVVNAGLFFNTQLTVNKCSIYKYIFADDWIQTEDLWYRKQLLYKLSHNHCPAVVNVTKAL